jgi:hypothetical protein
LAILTRLSVLQEQTRKNFDSAGNQTRDGGASLLGLTQQRSRVSGGVEVSVNQCNKTSSACGLKDNKKHPSFPQLRSRLSNAGVNPYDLSLVSHTECGPEATAPEAGIHINPETFSSHNIGQAVKKVGESIGDGVESLSDGAKKLFHKIKGDGEGKDREEVDVRVLGGNRQVTTEQYAEWLP